MKAVLLRYATPFITGLFLISLLSGVALFFHLGSALFKGMHEWLSMVLIAPFVLHLWKNWRPMTAYLKHRPMAIALVVSLVAATPFAVGAAIGDRNGGAPPQLVFARLIIGHPPQTVAPLLGETAQAMVARLKEAGFPAATATLPLDRIAAQSGKTERALLATLSQRGAE